MSIESAIRNAKRLRSSRVTVSLHELEALVSSKTATVESRPVNVGELRDLSAEQLTEIKRELKKFSVTSGEWTESPD